MVFMDEAKTNRFMDGLTLGIGFIFGDDIVDHFTITGLDKEDMTQLKNMYEGGVARTIQTVAGYLEK